VQKRVQASIAPTHFRQQLRTAHDCTMKSTARTMFMSHAWVLFSRRPRPQAAECVPFCLRGCGSEHPQLYLQSSCSLTHRLNKARCRLLLLSSTISISPLAPVSGPAHVTSSLYQTPYSLSSPQRQRQRPTPNARRRRALCSCRISAHPPFAMSTSPAQPGQANGIGR
jgi:hypothetical protein